MDGIDLSDLFVIARDDIAWTDLYSCGKHDWEVEVNEYSEPFNAIDAVCPQCGGHGTVR